MPDQDPENIRPQLLEDVAESKSSEQLAQEAYDRGLKDGFLRAVGTAEHFVGNQLAVAFGFLELLTKTPNLDQDTRYLINTAFDGSKEATDYLKRMRDVKDFKATINLGGPDMVDLNKIKPAASTSEENQNS